jgi:hypothetical protein
MALPSAVNVRRPVVTRTGTVVQCVFFSIFLMAGLGGFYVIFMRPMANLIAARQWTATPCRIVSSQLVSQRGSKGGNTYRIAIRYSYSVDGQMYQGDRYDFFGGSSSGYKSKADIVARYRAGTEATCYVNPRVPNQTVLDRRFTAPMLLGLMPLVFVFIGGGGIFWAIWYAKNAKRRAAILASGFPWQVRADWAAGRVQSSTKSRMVFLWVVAVLWNSFTLPLLFLLSGDADRNNPGIWIALIFPISGFGLLAAAVHATLRWRKYGRSVFEMTSVPGVIGGALEGNICLGQLLRPEGGCHLHLRCLRRLITGSGKGRSTTESVLWETEHETTGGMLDVIPVLFAIPPEAQSTDDANPNDQIIWRLIATAKVPGIPLQLPFDVPVFNVEPTAQQIAAGERARAAERIERAGYHPPAESRIVVQASGRGGREFIFPAGRNPGAASGLTFFLLLWTGAIWLQLHFKAPLIFPIVSSLVELFFIWGVLSLWFRRTRVVIESGTLTVTSNVLGLSWKRTAATGDIERIFTAVGMSSGNSVYRDIKVAVRGGTTFYAGTKLKDSREAEWLAAEMAKAAGLSSQIT